MCLHPNGVPYWKRKGDIMTGGIELVGGRLLAIGGAVAVVYFWLRPLRDWEDQAEGDPQRSALRLNASWASRALLRDTL